MSKKRTKIAIRQSKNVDSRIEELTEVPDIHELPDIHEVVKHFQDVKGVHEACLDVPPASLANFKALCNSLSQDGFKEELGKITLTENGQQLLDGRTRLMACHIVKVTPVFQTTDESPVTFMMSNVARRHLTTGQKAAMAARQIPKIELELSNQSSSNGVNSSQGKKPGRKGFKVKAMERAAAEFGISKKSIERYQQIERDDKDLAECIFEGTLTISKSQQILESQNTPTTKKQVKRKRMKVVRCCAKVEGEARAIATDKAIAGVHEVNGQWQCFLFGTDCCEDCDDEKAAITRAEELLLEFEISGNVNMR